ncbi:MAG: peptidoglycan DD-metalloendopeptidase family protein [Nitrospirota bacterium]
MKKLPILILFLSITLVFAFNFKKKNEKKDIQNIQIQEQERYQEICGTIEKGETLYDIFKKYNLNLGEFIELKEASADVHKLRNLYPGQPYKIIIDDSSQINEFLYWIDGDNILNIKRTESGFYAEKIPINYEKKIEYIGGMIKDNLILSVGGDKEKLLLALKLSDIFAWDIDFTTDLRNGDIFKIVVEGLYLDGEFKRYGKILSAEFVNNGKTYRAYRFEHDKTIGYYDEEGKSLRKAFLKAPLRFSCISSRFSNNRLHPILKIYRPHHGLDYVAPRGTPVSTVGDGTVIFSGYKGDYGKLIMIRHPNGYKTYYGHLSKIKDEVKRGVKVQQGQIIGYVGATGLATGPHLHYEMRINDKPINPLKIKLPRGEPVAKTLMSEFIKIRDEMTSRLASIKIQPLLVSLKDNQNKADGRTN